MQIYAKVIFEGITGQDNSCLERRFPSRNGLIYTDLEVLYQKIKCHDGFHFCSDAQCMYIYIIIYEVYCCFVLMCMLFLIVDGFVLQVSCEKMMKVLQVYPIHR